MMSALLLILSFAALALAINRHQQDQQKNTGIVMVSSTYVKSAPDAASSDLFMIHEGARIQILDHVREWNKIRLEDGKVGWMEQGKFEKI